MKIKCPFEPFREAPDYTERELSIHLHEDHETREIIADYICRLLFKIHEKIESLEKHEPQLKQGLGTIESLGQLKALKSLLK